MEGYVAQVRIEGAGEIEKLRHEITRRHIGKGYPNSGATLSPGSIPGQAHLDVEVKRGAALALQLEVRD